MTTADYALIVSLASAATSIFALAWNVWQKYIFVKPKLQVTFGIYSILQGPRAQQTLRPSGHRLLQIAATNLGPGPVMLYACVVKSKAGYWRRLEFGLLNPIHGDPASPQPMSIGPFSGGLPKKIEPGEMQSFYFPYNKDCCLKETLHRVGIADTYGRNTWCRRRDVKKAAATYLRDFGEGGGTVAENESETVAAKKTASKR